MLLLQWVACMIAIKCDLNTGLPDQHMYMYNSVFILYCTLLTVCIHVLIK